MNGVRVLRFCRGFCFYCQETTQQCKQGVCPPSPAAQRPREPLRHREQASDRNGARCSVLFVQRRLCSCALVMRGWGDISLSLSFACYFRDNKLSIWRLYLRGQRWKMLVTRSCESCQGEASKFSKSQPPGASKTRTSYTIFCF